MNNVPTYDLPTMHIEEVHYWAVVMHDGFREDAEWPARFTSKEAAEAFIEKMIAKKLAQPWSIGGYDINAR